MNKFICINAVLAFLGILSTLAAVSSTDTLLLSHEDITITFEEAFAYSLRHTNPEAYAVSMSKPQATFRILENLYVLKRVAKIVEQSETVSVSEREYLANDLYRRALLEKYLEDAISKRMAEIDWDGLAKAEYAQRKTEFKSPEQVRVEHLLVSIDGVSFDSFVTKVLQIQQALAAPGDFAELVAKYSEDPSASQNGGDLGFFSRERMQPTFSEAAFAIEEVGTVVGPVMTRFGAHFIRLMDRREEDTVPFEKIRESLIKEIKASTKSRLRSEFLDNFRAEIEAELAELDEPATLSDFLSAYGQLNTTIAN